MRESRTKYWREIKRSGFADSTCLHCSGCRCGCREAGCSARDPGPEPDWPPCVRRSLSHCPLLPVLCSLWRVRGLYSVMGVAGSGPARGPLLCSAGLFSVHLSVYALFSLLSIKFSNRLQCSIPISYFNILSYLQINCSMLNTNFLFQHCLFFNFDIR